MGDFARIAGLWRLVATADGELTELAPRVRFWVCPTAGGGGIEVELGADCRWEGPWRAGRSGMFLAGISGASGTASDRFRTLDRAWVRDAVATTDEGDELTLWDQHGAVTARLTRPTGAAGDPSATDHDRRIAPLPRTLVPASREQLLGAWSPVAATPYRTGWQHIEFRDDGTWRAFPRGILNGGRWSAGPCGELLAIHPYAVPLGYAPAGGVHDWILDTAHAGFDGNVLVVLDEDGVELLRLTRPPGDTGHHHEPTATLAGGDRATGDVSPLQPPG